MSGHIYLLQEREFIRLRENVYKLGRTSQSLRRFKGYPHDSHILIVLETQNVVQTETNLIHAFKRIFKHMPQYGNEYFMGDSAEMKRLIIDECCRSYNPIGIISWLFQSLNIFATTPLAITAPEPITLDNAVDNFCKHIHSTRPKWYKPGEYMSSDELLQKFIHITKFEVKMPALSGRIQGRIFDEKKRKKVQGRSITMYRLIKITTH